MYAGAGEGPSRRAEVGIRGPAGRGPSTQSSVCAGCRSCRAAFPGLVEDTVCTSLGCIRVGSARLP